jgi:hypothetical protein
MKKKYLIVVADYYEDIAKGLLDSALKLIQKLTQLKLLKSQVFLKYQLQYQKILKDMMLF